MQVPVARTETFGATRAYVGEYAAALPQYAADSDARSVFGPVPTVQLAQFCTDHGGTNPHRLEVAAPGRGRTTWQPSPWGPQRATVTRAAPGLPGGPLALAVAPIAASEAIAFQDKGRVQTETGRTPENAEAEQAPHGELKVPMPTSTLDHGGEGIRFPSIGSPHSGTY